MNCDGRPETNEGKKWRNIIINGRIERKVRYLSQKPRETLGGSEGKGKWHLEEGVGLQDFLQRSMPDEKNIFLIASWY